MPDHPSTLTNDVEPTRKRFSLVRIIAVCVVTAWCWLAYVAIFGTEAVTARTQRVLAKTTFGHLEIRDATLSEAVEIYRKALNQAGINEERIRVRVLDSDKTAFLSTAIDKRGSIVLFNMPASEAGKCVVNLFHLRLSIVGKEVRIHPIETELVRRTIRIKSGFNPDRYRQDRGRGLTPRNADGSYDMRVVLLEMGILVPEGAWAKMEPGSGKLDVLLTDEAVNLFESSGLVENRVTWHERITMWIRSWF